MMFFITITLLAFNPEGSRIRSDLVVVNFSENGQSASSSCTSDSSVCESKIVKEREQENKRAREQESKRDRETDREREREMHMG